MGHEKYWMLKYASESYIKNFKASNVQDTNEEIPLLLGVQHLVDTDDHPQEHPFID